MSGKEDKTEEKAATITSRKKKDSRQTIQIKALLVDSSDQLVNLAFRLRPSKYEK